MQYSLEESVYHRRTRQVTQLFTYLLTHNLFSFCIWRYLVSRVCDWMMPALSPVLLNILGPHQHCGVLLVLIRNIGHRTLPKIWGGTFLVRNVQPRKYFELILTVKMETRHPVEEPFGSEFPAICNHCGVTIDGLKSWKSCEQFLRVLEKLYLSNCGYCANRAKNLPGAAPTFGSHCSRFHLHRFTFGRLIAERVKTVFAP